MGCHASTPNTYNFELDRSYTQWFLPTSLFRDTGASQTQSQNKPKTKTGNLFLSPPKPCYLIRLPDCLFSVLQEFLSSSDTRHLLTTAHTPFQSLRQSLVRYNLNPLASYQYALDCNKHVRKYFSTKVNGAQVGLCLKRLCEEELAHTSLHLLSNLYHLSLVGCGSIRHVRDLVKMPYLYFESCQNLSDITSLSSIRQRSVVLIDCSLVSDVRSLRGVSVVVLRDCSGIRDVSCLVDVQLLEVSRCEHIRSMTQILYNPTTSTYTTATVSSLSRASSAATTALHRKIHFEPPPIPPTVDGRDQISHIAPINRSEDNALISDAIATSSSSFSLVNASIRDITALFSAPHHLTSLICLELARCPSINSDDLSVFASAATTTPSLCRVRLIECDNLASVAMFGAMRCLSIIRCHRLTSIAGLGQGNYSISIEDCALLSDLSPLRMRSCNDSTNSGVKEIVLTRFHYEVDCEVFRGSVELLALIRCHNISFRGLQAGRRLHTLRLEDCINVRRLGRELSSVRRIWVQRCGDLMDVRGCMGGEGELIVEDCQGIYPCLYERIHCSLLPRGGINGSNTEEDSNMRDEWKRKIILKKR